MAPTADDVAADDGLSRRSLIQRGVLAGSAGVWLAPVLQSFTQPAFAAVGSPPPRGKDFSYVVLVYRCDAGLMNVKFELNDDGMVTKCEDKADVNAPKCNDEVDGLGAADKGDCSHFDVSSPAGGLSITASFAAGAQGPCTFFSGGGVGKCGNPPVNGECVPGVISANGATISFSLCGV